MNNIESSRFLVSILDDQDNIVVDCEKAEADIYKMLQYVFSDSEVIEGSAVAELYANTEEFENLIFSVDVVFCDDQQIHRLNYEYRAKDKPTDVLSFALFADNISNGATDFPHRLFPDRTVSLGEIFISVDTAKRQANEKNISFKEELSFLLSHGILHLLGFDHPDENSLEDMLALQYEMMNSLEDI